MKMKKKKKTAGRTRALFNTGTRPHTSLKDYSRKVKHKKKINKDDENF
ncbi:hypothetical protein [Desulfosporosinus sp. HMP52]|nr:hypothetical protein [Desulfosporosinus sp. HMP52]